MSTRTYSLTLREDVSAGSRADLYNFRTAHHQMPGTVVRGALASAMINDPHSPVGLTRAEGVAAYHQALPELSVSFAIPAGSVLEHQSMARCKYVEADCPERDARDLALASETGVVPSDWHWCGKSASVPQEGGLSWGRGWKPPPSGTMVTRSRSALTGGVPAQGQLFSRQAVRRGVTLTGTITIGDGVAPDLHDWLLEEREITLGGNTSVLGRCWWTVDPVTRSEPEVHRLAGGRSVLILQSSAILLDRFGGTTLDLGSHLATLTQRGKITKCWVRGDAVYSWNGVAGLPRPIDLAVAGGSVALLSPEWTDEELRQLVTQGLGIRRREGYGHVALLAPPEPTASR